MDKKTYRRRAASVLLFVIVFFAAAMLTGEESYAAETETIKDSSIQVSENTKLDLSKDNYTAQWNGVKGKTETGSEGEKMLCVPVKKTDASWTLSDFLDITFTNAGSINGRQIDVKVHINKLTVGKRSGSADGEMSDRYMGVCILRSRAKGLQFSASMKDGCGYRASKVIEHTVTVFYHDTGGAVDLPFFQAVKDLDASASYFSEAWEPVSGYDSTYYIYPSNYLIFSGDKASAPPGNVNMTGTDQMLKAGLYAVCSKGSFRARFYGGNCGTMMNLYNQYDILEKPVKTSDGRDITEPGERMTYRIQQTIGTFFKDMMTPYREFVISDPLPEGVRYISSEVTGSISGDMSKAGSLSYDEKTRKVSFVMEQIWLKDKNNYNGEKIEIKVICEAESEDPEKIVKNKASVSYGSGLEYQSNETTDRICRSFRAVYRYVSGSPGYDLPSQISVSEGRFAVSDDAGYHKGEKVSRQARPENGTVYTVNDETGVSGKWVLEWDHDEKTVDDRDVVFTGTWKYTASPELVIEKKIPEDCLSPDDPHGNPGCLFEIRGRDTGLVWYRSVYFDQQTLRLLAEGRSEVNDKDKDAVFTCSGGYVKAEIRGLHLPEDDYIVKEIPASRYASASVEAAYISESHTTQIEGSMKNMITVPLKISGYRKDEPGYKAVSAVVTHTHGLCPEQAER